MKAGWMTEEHLQGGFVNLVVRVGDTVRRQPGERAGFIHELLRHFEAQEWLGAPRFLGMDDDGREMLSYVDGYVAWNTPRSPATTSLESLSSIGRLVREFHDLTAGTPLAGDQEVVCHNDLSPKNTVYAGSGAQAIAFIDWDIAAPGQRIHDLAFCCWQYTEVGQLDLHLAIDRWRAICDGYGPTDRSALVATVLWWQDRTWRGIEAAAATGDGPMSRLVELGVPADIRRAHDWVAANADVLESAVQ
jgi:tRNA A-37 threonylcarbamoyl transferase component Bud32